MNPIYRAQLLARLTGKSHPLSKRSAKVVEPRGIPEDLGRKAHSSYWLSISEEWANDETIVTPGTAEGWVNHGFSRFSGGDHPRVSNPDAHTLTWLNADEWGKATEGAGVDYSAVLVLLRHFEAMGCEARVVVWFDN